MNSSEGSRDEDPAVSAQEVRGERRTYLQVLAARSAARQKSEWPWLTNLAVQLRRAIPPDDRALQHLLAEGLRALNAQDADATRGNLFECLEHFPWQRNGFGRWTDEPDWRQQFPQFDSDQLPIVRPGHDAVALEPAEALTSSDLIIIAGNRAHLSGVEWQDPLFLGTKITSYAQRYTRRYLEELSQIFVGVEQDRWPSLVALTCNAIENRHENRLEHFKLYQEPSWTHPRLIPTALAIFRPVFSQITDDGDWIKKSDSEIDSAPAFRALTFSIGGTVAEQLFNEAVRIARQLGVAPEVSARYFQRCFGVYIGGYMANNIVTDLPIKRYLMVSFLDENVVGSPEVDGQAALRNNVHFTSPLQLPFDPWEHLAADDIDALSDGNYLSCRAFPLTDLHVPNVRLALFAGEVARNALNSSDSETMRLTRFGHRIPPQIEAIRKHYPVFGSELVARLKA